MTSRSAANRLTDPLASPVRLAVSATRSAGSSSQPLGMEHAFHEQLANLRHETFVSFARMQDSVSIWAADSRGMQFQIAESPLQTVVGFTDDLLQLLRDRNSSTKKIASIGRKLYQTLFHPIASFLESSRGLVVHFGGDLVEVPVAALQTESGEFLIERCPFVHAVDFPWQANQTRQSSIPGEAKLLIVDGPASGDPKDGSGQIRQDSLRRTELLEIAASLPFNDMICQESATREQFNRLAPHAEVLHCRAAMSSGTHGPQLHLAAETQRRSTQQKESLALQPVASYRRRALERCILAVMDVDYVARRSGDSPDLWRQTCHALHYAGVGNVVIPRWNAARDARAVFHRRLYKELMSGVSIGESCRRGVRELRSHPKWAHPHFWAGFTQSVSHLSN